MSFLPSINIGRDTSRSVFSLDQDTNTTAEIGYFQPTFCRNIVPGSDIKISSRSFVRLSPLCVPTFGRLSLRNYYYYVDISTLWTPFDAFRNQTNYTFGDGTVGYAKRCPTFRLIDFFKSVMAVDNSLTRSAWVRQIREDLVCTVYKNGVRSSSASTDINLVISQMKWVPFVVIQNSTTGARFKSAESSSSVSYNGVFSDPDKTKSYPIVTNENADFAWTYVSGSDTVTILGKFLGSFKRLRKIFLGCGYSFNPLDDSRQTPFKLLAVFKAWYDTFGVTRTMNFNNTYCYQVIKKLSETYVGGSGESDIYDSTAGNYDAGIVFSDFVSQLADICYILPPDYFSASDVTTLRGAMNADGSGSYLESAWQDTGTTSTINAMVHLTSPAAAAPSTAGGAYDQSALGMTMAQRLMRFVNKRSVIGRKIADLLKLSNEVDLHNNEHESVHHLGSDSTQINISDVMSLASTADAGLGDYAGKGIGFGDDDTFKYDAKSYGILLCLTAVVPTSGYNQGMLRENSDRLRFDYFTTDFDAVGYQTLRMNELVSDYQFDSSLAGANPRGTNLGNFGLVPRYQHMKVGRNIASGDISLPSLESVMSPYQLDRHFVTRIPDGSTCFYKTVSTPVNAPETFRAIKANDSYGDYNRIFQYVGSDYDHFIIQMIFDAKITSPMKSISNSYDTFDTDDDSTIEVSHE